MSDDKTKILVVDDRIENLVAMEAILEDVDITVVKALSGIEALRQYCLIMNLLLFFWMFRCLKWMVLRRLSSFAAMPKSVIVHIMIPVIALTAYAAAGDERTFLDAGMDDYMSKPLDINLLLKKINAYESV